MNARLYQECRRCSGSGLVIVSEEKPTIACACVSKRVVWNGLTTPQIGSPTDAPNGTGSLFAQLNFWKSKFERPTIPEVVLCYECAVCAYGWREQIRADTPEPERIAICPKCEMPTFPQEND